MKKQISVLLALMTVLCMLLCGCAENDEITEYVKHTDWATDVKTAINTLITDYGKDSEGYDETTYAVFDFDNTSSIFDVEEQLAAYQLINMAFEIKPEEIKTVLATGLSDLDADLTELGYGNGSYKDWIDDIYNAYAALYESYGPFCAKGVAQESLSAMHKDAQWLEFATKMRAMFDVVYDNESAAVAYPWIFYWFAGMTEQQLYELAYASHKYYAAVETSEVIWESPKEISSKVGSISFTWKSGIQVTENIKELMKNLNDNGIKVWICSASLTDVIRAGVDAWGLHDSVTGVLAMTNKTDADGKYIAEYDYDGCGWICGDDGAWTKDTLAQKAQTYQEGKVTAIDNTLCVKYSHGPIAGFMDSTGDYNFCTEFKTLKLVVCFNRADRKVTDGGGVISELAVYQRDTLGYDLRKANAAGDTLYVLQGRNENGTRTFTGSDKTVKYGQTEEKLFANENNEKQLQYMIDNAMTTQDIINGFCIKTPEGEGNALGFAYGFFDKFAGYHTHE